MAAIIQTYQRREVEQATGATPVRAAESAVGQLGEAVTGVGTMLFEWQDEIDTADAKSADADFANLIREQLYGADTGYMYATGGDAVNRRGKVSELIEAEQKRILSDLSPAARARAQDSLTARYQRTLQTIDQHATTEGRAYLDRAAQARIAAGTSDAIYDPGLVKSTINTNRSEILDMAERNGWSPDETALKIREADTAVHSGVVTRIAAVDPVRALEYLRENKDQMLGTEVARLEGVLITRVKERRGRAAGAAAAVSGVSDTYLASIRQAESSGNDAAKNPLSTASGRYQFLASTWAGLMRDHPELGLTPDGRFDPEQQERAIRVFTRDNARQLQRGGLSPTNGNLYAAHFLGAGRAVTVLNARDDLAMAAIVPQEVIEANPFLSGMTVGRFKAWANEKGGGTEIGYSEAPGGIESLLNIEDPVEREAAIAEFNLRSGLAQAQAESARQAAEDAAFALIVNGGNIDDIPEQHRIHIGMDAMRGLRSYQAIIASGREPTTDDRFYVDLSDMASSNPEAFMQADPMVWRDKLDKGDFEYFVKMRADMRAGRRDASNDVGSLSSIRTLTTTAMETAGYDRADSRDLEGKLLRHMIEWKRANPDADDGQAYMEANRALSRVVIRGTVGFGRVDMAAVDIDFGGRTLTTEDDLAPEDFFAALSSGNLRINGETIPEALAQQVIRDLWDGNGRRQPTPDEVLGGILAALSDPNFRFNE